MPPWQEPCYPSQKPFKSSFFENLSKIESPDTKSWKPSLAFKVVHRIEIFDCESLLKTQNLVPLDESQENKFSETLLKTESSDDMVVVLSVLRSLKHEKEGEAKIVTSSPLSGVFRPNFNNRFHEVNSKAEYQGQISTGDSIKYTLHEISEIISSFGELLHENGRKRLFKNICQM